MPGQHMMFKGITKSNGWVTPGSKMMFNGIMKSNGWAMPGLQTMFKDQRVAKWVKPG